MNPGLRAAVRDAGGFQVWARGWAVWAEELKEESLEAFPWCVCCRVQGGRGIPRLIVECPPRGQPTNREESRPFQNMGGVAVLHDLLVGFV